MSILTLDKRVFHALASKMADCANNNKLDINYLHGCKNIQQSKITVLVNHWYVLNMDTYRVTYEERFNIPVKPINLSFNLLPCDTYQFLKWLECLDYNIDLETIVSGRKITTDEKEAHAFLLRLIADAMKAIVNSLPAYQAAKWCEY